MTGIYADPLILSLSSGPVTEIIVSTSAAIMAVAAVGIHHRLNTLVSQVEKHDRTLYGAEGIDSWEGLVSRVAAHETELESKREDTED